VTASHRRDLPDLGERQAAVLRALVGAFVGGAAPVGSRSLSHLLSEHLSPASIRNTLAELAQLGLVEKPHASAGRVPTESGLRLIVDHLLPPRPLDRHERRDLAGLLDDGDCALTEVASDLLSRRTRQLGFAIVPGLERLRVQHVSLVRLSRERVLAVLVSTSGAVVRRVIDESGRDDQPELDRIAASLTQLAAGRTLTEVRALLQSEARALRALAGRLLERAERIGRLAVEHADADAADLVIATRLALLDQPEFRDPERVRELLEAVETKEQLIAVLDRMLDTGGVSVAIGSEAEQPLLRAFSLVVAPFGGSDPPLGLVGVLGPIRMDYGRVIPLVGGLSELMTDRFEA